MAEQTPNMPYMTEEDQESFETEADDILHGINMTNWKKLSKEAVDKLRELADSLDGTWKDCRIACAVGQGVGCLGGLATVVGGIATFATAGVAPLVLAVGIAAGVAGAGTNIGTSAVEARINALKLKEAEEAIKKADEVARKVKEEIETWRGRKDNARLFSLGYLALHALELDDIAMNLLQVALTQSRHLTAPAGEAVTAVAEVTAKASGKAGANLGAKAFKVFVGLNGVCALWDAFEFGFTVRDLLQKKGSEAAKALRKCADQREAQLKAAKMC